MAPTTDPGGGGGGTTPPTTPPGSVTPPTGSPSSGFDHDFLLTTFPMPGNGYTGPFDGGGGSFDSTGGSTSSTTSVTGDATGGTASTPPPPGTPVANGDGTFSVTIPLSSYYVQGVTMPDGKVYPAIGIGVTTTLVRTNSLPVPQQSVTAINAVTVNWVIKQTINYPMTQYWNPYVGIPVPPPPGGPIPPPFPPPPGMGTPVLNIWDGKAWQKIGYQSSQYVEWLKLNTGKDKAGWVKEIKGSSRSGWTDAHPLKIWDGLQWAFCTWMSPYDGSTIGAPSNAAANGTTAQFAGQPFSGSASFDGSSSTVRLS